MSRVVNQVAVVTGASSGIGYELAKLAAEEGFDLVVAADEPQIEDAARMLRSLGATVYAIQTDVTTTEGVDKVYAAARAVGRPITALFTNAGHSLGGAFLDQDPADWGHAIDTKVTGTPYLIHKLARDFRTRNEGRILITGSIASPGTRAFVDSFCLALRNELKDTAVTVTCLIAGPADSEFFARAGLREPELGQDENDDVANVARIGFEAMMNGEGDIASGWKNKLQARPAEVTPSEMQNDMAS